MTLVSALDPVADARWADLLHRHPGASVFHTPGWLEALRRTYGYQPMAVTIGQGDRLQAGVPLCRVRRLTSWRLVSLPFSDHCEPLVDDPEELAAILAFIRAEMSGGQAASVELRPRHVAPRGLAPDRGYYLHTLSLAPSVGDIFGRFHHSSTQRAIRRAEREGLHYERATSEPALEAFYHLLRLTRRRHGLPPQPFAWFRHLVACMGDRVAIHTASKDGQAVAAILTLTFKKTVVYKYGGSDAARHCLGSVPFLFWQIIQQAKAQGYGQLDLGRSDLDQPGLIAFKDHLGAERTPLTYYTSRKRRAPTPGVSRLALACRPLLARLPDAALDLTGRLLYKHLG